MFSGIKKLSCMALIAAMGLMAAPSFGATGFGNGDFEDGTFSGWNPTGGSWQEDYYDANSPYYPSSYNFSGSTAKLQVVTPGDVPELANYGVHVNQVFKGSYAARINTLDSGYHFSQISQSVTNWQSQYLYFAWNAVLEEPGHEHQGEPHFFVQLDDLTSGQNVYKLFYASDTLPSAIFKQVGPYYSPIKYTDWQQVQLDTAALYGHDLKLTILAADCGQGGHGGELYVDDISASRVITANLPPVAVPTATPNHGDAGDAVALDGSASYDPESDPLDAYEWDVTGDFIADFSTMNATFNIPLSWAAGSSHNVYLRVHETPNNALPQWSDWTAAVIRVNGGDPGPSTPLPLAAWSGLSLLGGMGLIRKARKA